MKMPKRWNTNAVHSFLFFEHVEQHTFTALIPFRISLLTSTGPGEISQMLMSVKCTAEEWTKEGSCASTSASTSRARTTARAQVATSCFQTGGTVKVSSRKVMMVELDWCWWWKNGGSSVSKENHNSWISFKLKSFVVCDLLCTSHNRGTFYDYF